MSDQLDWTAKYEAELAETKQELELTRFSMRLEQTTSKALLDAQLAHNGQIASMQGNLKAQREGFKRDLTAARESGAEVWPPEPAQPQLDAIAEEQAKGDHAPKQPQPDVEKALAWLEKASEALVSKGYHRASMCVRGAVAALRGGR